MLISRSKNLTIHIIRRLKLAVFTWHGFTPSDVFQEGTIESLETLRIYPDVNRIILNTKDHHMVVHEDINAAVNSTFNYLEVAKSNYKMAVVPPDDVLAKNSIDWYVDSLNHTLKKRFVVKKYETMKSAFSGLVVPKIYSFFKIKMGGKKPKRSMVFSYY